MSSVYIVGSGGWGTAIGVALADCGHSVTMWARRESAVDELRQLRENKAFLPSVSIPMSVSFTTSLEGCAAADLVVCALPSVAVGATMAMIRPYIGEGKVVVSLSKGIEAQSMLTMTGVIKRELPSAKVAVLSGPSHAEEVALRLPTMLVVGASDMAIAEYVQDVFMSPSLRVYTNDDVLGVELGGALKNVVALCAGISDGLGFGDNTKAALMTRGLHEIVRIGTAMGARAETFSGLSGIGDLIVTCTSTHSRNRRAGIMIGKGKSLDDVRSEINMVIEGIEACKSAKILGDKLGVEIPMISAAYGVIFEGKPARQSVEALMARAKRTES